VGKEDLQVGGVGGATLWASEGLTYLAGGEGETGPAFIFPYGASGL
jgi:hypothetical protein